MCNFILIFSYFFFLKILMRSLSKLLYINYDSKGNYCFEFVGLLV